MRKLIASTMVSLDGVMQAPGGPEEDPTCGFAWGGWSFNYWDDAMGRSMNGLDGKDRDLVLGRRTYEIFAATWPSLSGQLPYIDKLNSMAKHVASTTLTDLQWENSHLIEGDVADGVAKLKQQPGQDLVMYGCRNLMHTLLEHNLIDEYRILLHPVLLGKGRNFLNDGAKRVDLDLVDTTVIPPGIAVLTYQPAR